MFFTKKKSRPEDLKQLRELKCRVYELEAEKLESSNVPTNVIERFNAKIDDLIQKNMELLEENLTLSHECEYALKRLATMEEVLNYYKECSKGKCA